MFFSNTELNELLLLFNNGSWDLETINIIYSKTDYTSLEFWENSDQKLILMYLKSISIENEKGLLLFDKKTVFRRFKNTFSLSPLLDNLSHYNIDKNSFVATLGNVVLCESGNYDYILDKDRKSKAIVFNSSNKNDIDKLNSITYTPYYTRTFLLKDYYQDNLDTSLTLSDYDKKLFNLLNKLKSDSKINFKENKVQFNNEFINILDLIKYTRLCIKSLSLIDKEIVETIGFGEFCVVTTAQIDVVNSNDGSIIGYKRDLLKTITDASIIIDYNI